MDTSELHVCNTYTRTYLYTNTRIYDEWHESFFPGLETSISKNNSKVFGEL